MARLPPPAQKTGVCTGRIRPVAFSSFTRDTPRLLAHTWCVLARVPGCSRRLLCTRPCLPLGRVFGGLRGFAPTGGLPPAVPLNPPAGGIAPPLLGGLGTVGGHAAPRSYYGAPSGGTLGFVSLWPFRPPSPHARACLHSSPRVRIAPPAPPSGGVLGLTAVVFSAPHCFGIRARGCSSFIRRRQILS